MCGYTGRLSVILFIFIKLFFIFIFACYRFSSVLVSFGCFSLF